MVILRNDNASGIVSLSSPDISVQEGTREGFLNVVRSGGLFGEVLLCSDHLDDHVLVVVNE